MRARRRALLLDDYALAVDTIIGSFASRARCGAEVSVTLDHPVLRHTRQYVEHVYVLGSACDGVSIVQENPVGH